MISLVLRPICCSSGRSLFEENSSARNSEMRMTHLQFSYSRGSYKSLLVGGVKVVSNLFQMSQIHLAQSLKPHLQLVVPHHRDFSCYGTQKPTRLPRYELIPSVTLRHDESSGKSTTDLQ